MVGVNYRPADGVFGSVRGLAEPPDIAHRCQAWHPTPIMAYATCRKPSGGSAVLHAFRHLKAREISWEISPQCSSEMKQVFDELRSFPALRGRRPQGLRKCHKGVVVTWWPESMRKMTFG